LFIENEENGMVKFNEACESCDCSDQCKQGYKVKLFSCKKFEPNERCLITINQFIEARDVTPQLVSKRLSSTLKDYVVEVNGEKFLKKSVLDIPRKELCSMNSKTEK